MTAQGIEEIRTELRKSMWTWPSGRLHADYWASREEHRRVVTRNGCWLALLVYVAFAAVDLVVLPDVAERIIASRLLVAVCIGLVFETSYRLGADADTLDVLCAIGIVASFYGWLIPSSWTQDQAMFRSYCVFSAIFMMGANLFFLFRPIVAFLVCAVVLLTMFSASYASASAFAVSSMVFNGFYVTCYVFTFYMNVRGNRDRYRTYLSARQAAYLQRESDERGKELLKQSRTDFLTGVDNRRSLDTHLADWWMRWCLRGESFAILLIDIDFFKKFNDGQGHLAGDRCLIRIAAPLQQAAAEHGGHVGRFGGEEFLMIAPVADADAVAALGETIRSRVAALEIEHGYRRDGLSNVTVSVGASFTRAPMRGTVERVIHEADRALYLAKAHGRNTVHLFDPADPQANEELENVAALLKIGLERDLVSLVYQPIVGVASGEVEAVETLMRLRTLDGVNVPPSLFIPIAENTGAILPLGRWAIETVCRDVLAPSVVALASVNVSATQLRVPGFARSVADILDRTGVPGSRLALEITEGLEIDMDAAVLHAIGELRELGIRIWLDDFGTGFAGLSWLRLIDFDTVKVDKSFLHDLDKQTGRNMLRDIIALLRNRGTSILIEGVETPEQFDFAKDHGLDHVQGYLLGRPEPLGHLLAGKDPVRTSDSRRPGGRSAAAVVAG